ncbi:MAG: tripartite tricarboxylate transporter substrate binding protein [Proteobacteria bacterium]|nr:tripartite tricarboxylate transporter substrate binding protein [Pseudomonadota bacterium]
MSISRRRILQAAGAAAVLPMLSHRAAAVDYPSRPIRWIVSFPPGGGNDVVARLIAQPLSEKLGQSIVVENKTGAGGNVGMAALVNAPPDGYTIGFVGPNNAISAAVYDNLPFDFIRDTVPVGGTMLLSNVLEVHPDLPVHTVAELIAYAKANPGKLNWVHPGAGTSPHMAGELFKIMAGVDVTAVPYRGGAPAMADLLPGRVQMMFDNLTGSVEVIKSGRVRPLGVSVPKRVPALPDVPPISDTIPGFEVNVFHGICVPKGTPREIVDVLYKALAAVIADPALQARFVGLGGEALPLSPDAFGKLVATETEKWIKVAKTANIKVE